MNYNVKKSDILVIGGGLAGIRAADTASAAGSSVIVVSKGPRCSARVSGFNAPVGADDSEQLFLEDIMDSGTTLNDPALGNLLAHNAPIEVQYLEELGVPFQKNHDGSYHLLQPLRCSVPRLVHAGTVTGAEAERVILNSLSQKGVSVEESVTITAILICNGSACGALGYKAGSEELTIYISKAVVLAAGGCGGVYNVSTYPKAICGSSAALAYRAGAELTNMEFIEFEPCCLMAPENHRGRGISSTMLFVGGCLRNNLGENIIPKYFSSLSEISKSTLSKAIWTELQEGRGTPNGGMWYDLTAVPREELAQHEEHLPLLERLGFDLSKDYLEVAPAAHTCLGGVKIDAHCQSSIHGLFAAGEAVGNLHGANRIGGNAGAEVFVFGAIAGASAAEYASKISVIDDQVVRAAFDYIEQICPHIHEGQISPEDCAAGIRNIISTGAPLLRCKSKLEAVSDQLTDCLAKVHFDSVTADSFTSYCELLSMAQVSRIITQASMLRQESRGVFNRSDYPDGNSRFDYTNTIISCKNGDLHASLRKSSY